MKGFLQRHKMVITAVVAAATTIILYWPSLHLPIVYDTLQHIRISDDMTLATAWIPTDKFGFYRPFAFIPFILIREIFGGYPNWLLHGLNIAQHGLNVFLLVILAWRLGSSWARALVAGLLFALFPFSYRAIVIYGNNVYPFTIGLILLGLNTYLTAIKTQRPEGKDNPPIFQRSFFWWAVTGFIFLSGLFSHEMMVLFGLLAALVHFNDPAQPPLGSNAPALRATFYNFYLLRSHPWLLFLLVDIVYVIGYQFLPISIGPSEAITANEGGLWVRAQYMLQAGAYPFTWTAHLLPNMTAKTIILGGTAVTLGLTLWAARRRENWRPLLLGWGWWGVASALVAIPLPTGYLLRGPRLLYLSSVGLGLAWATIVTGSLGHGTNGKRKSSLFNPKFLISTLFLAYVLMTNWQYIREKLADYVELTDPVAVMNEVMAERPSSEGVVLINLPQWLAPPRNSYAIGGEYVVMLGTHLFVEELIIANEGPQSV
ncbi:MAG: hypothetical protein GY803_18955, partial [Chloroflexi bacterium]|nr:hypothetical protein [Chloroflexota bacterium]